MVFSLFWKSPLTFITPTVANNVEITVRPVNTFHSFLSIEPAIILKSRTEGAGSMVAYAAKESTKSSGLERRSRENLAERDPMN